MKGPTLPEFLSSKRLDAGLISVVVSVASSCGRISRALRTSLVKKVKTTNEFGDEVLSVDLIADKIIGEELVRNTSVYGYASEEHPELIRAHPEGKHLVAFDPLDGSSIIDTNFSVGSIFGVWKGTSIIGQKVKDQVASAIAVYGPRTVLIIALPGHGVYECLFVADALEHHVNDPSHPDAWRVLNPEGPFKIKAKAKYFAPGNLRAANDLGWYKELLKESVKEEKTLRYTGGMVPDVAQIFIKGNGVFMTPQSPSHKMKLRVCFECGPIAFLVHEAGGASTDGKDTFMNVVITSMDQRAAIAVGSSTDIAKYQAMLSMSKAKL